MNQPRILITGAGGLLGWRVVRLFIDECHLFLHYHHPLEGGAPPDSIVGDLGEMPIVEELAGKFAPQVIINCAALADVDRCEREPGLSYRANVTAVKNLLVAFPDAKLVHISTDYIFNGAAPAKPEDKPAPMNIYGQHKLAAEKLVLAASPKNLVVRTNSTYDHLGRYSFFHYVYGNLTSGKEVYGVTDQTSNPIGAFNAAALILRLLKKEAAGVFHIGGKDFVSRCEFSRMIAEFFGLRSVLIVPVTSRELVRPARRPKIAGLDCAATESFLGSFMPSLADQFGWIREELRQNQA